MILYINACVRENSRTAELAKALLSKMGEEYTERRLDSEALLPLSRDRLEYRTRQLEKQNYDDPVFAYAKEFTSAKKIIISEPLWNLSIPSLLTEYLENVYVRYSSRTARGTPEGLCRAEKLIRTTSANVRRALRFDYIRELCLNTSG